jgi:hypothetical protein
VLAHTTFNGLKTIPIQKETKFRLKFTIINKKLYTRLKTGTSGNII